MNDERVLITTNLLDVFEHNLNKQITSDFHSDEARAILASIQELRLNQALSTPPQNNIMKVEIRYKGVLVPAECRYSPDTKKCHITLLEEAPSYIPRFKLQSASKSALIVMNAIRESLGKSQLKSVNGFSAWFISESGLLIDTLRSPSP